MKSIHNKIVAIALAGIAAGGVVASSIKVYAIDYIVDPSSGLLVPIVPIKDEFNPELYPKQYPKLEVPKEYIYRISSKGDVLPKGNDQGMDRLLNALKGSGFSLIKASGLPGVIDEYVENVDIPILKLPQFCFKDINHFRKYISSLKIKPKPPKGVCRFMIGGFDGLFYFDPVKLINMYDEVMINLQYIQRNESKYKYKVLDFNLDGQLILKKYKQPIELESVNEFFEKMRDFKRRKVPGHFGSVNHGGVQPGGIYCIKIGDLVLLFRALE